MRESAEAPWRLFPDGWERSLDKLELTRAYEAAFTTPCPVCGNVGPRVGHDRQLMWPWDLRPGTPLRLIMTCSRACAETARERRIAWS
jgi:hypothetical protein